MNPRPSTQIAARAEVFDSAVIRAHFKSGRELLLSEARWRWLTEHMKRAEVCDRAPEDCPFRPNKPGRPKWCLAVSPAEAKKKCGYSQADVAKKAGMDPAQFARLLNRTEDAKTGKVKRVTDDEYRTLRYGLDQLRVELSRLEEPGQLSGSVDPELENRCYTAAGFIFALNALRNDDSRRFGVIDYFCLQQMCTSAAWQKAWAERVQYPEKLEPQAKTLYQAAVNGSKALHPHVLQNYRQPEIENPRLPRAPLLQNLSATWLPYWRQVYYCMNPPTPNRQ